MKIGIFALCVLLSGASASFFDDITNSLKNLAHTALTSITPENVEKLVETVAPAAISTAITAATALGKRDSEELNAVLQSAANTVGQVLHSYADKLQQHHHDLHSFGFLKGDVQQFIADIENTKLTHNAALDSIVSNVKNYLNSLKSKKRQAPATGNLLDGLGNIFSSTVNSLKETFGGVADTLHQGAGGILQNIHDHLTGLLSNSAGVLASGQEALQNLQSQASALFHQAQAGVQGQSSQLLDTLLHPASNN